MIFKDRIWYPASRQRPRGTQGGAIIWASCRGPTAGAQRHLPWDVEALYGLHDVLVTQETPKQVCAGTNVLSRVELFAIARRHTDG